MGSPEVSSDVTKETLALMLSCDEREGLLNLSLNWLSFQNPTPESFCLKMYQDEHPGPTHTPAAGSEKLRSQALAVSILQDLLKELFPPLFRNSVSGS